MKHRFEKRILSLILCITMVLTIVITNANFAFSATYSDGAIGGSEYSEELENNIGKQAIFDWWDIFDLAPDVNSKPGEANRYNDDDLFVEERVFVITDYYYNDGEHWYKLASGDGMELPEILGNNPWVLYAYDIDFEVGTDPYLCIYEANETIRFVKDVDNYYSFVFAGPSELANTEIVVEESYTGLINSNLTNIATSAKPFNVTIDKATGDAVDLWNSNDGIVSIRYEAALLGLHDYYLCGAAFLYIDGKVFSATTTDIGGYDRIECSDVVYTNSGTSMMVFELMNDTFEYRGEKAYFVNDSVTLYNNQMQAAEFLAAQLPLTFTAEYSFTYEGEKYLWLEDKGFIGSPYFIAKAEDVVPGELPEEYGDGRVSITDKMGNSVSEIVLPQYEKPEFSAISSLSQSTADVKYQWQICYDTVNDLWVDIYGENNANIKISLGMVATLLNGDLSVNFRCETKDAYRTAYSSVIPVTLELYEYKEPDAVVSENFVTSNGETVTVSVAGDIPEDASVALEETDSTGVDVNPGETVVASLDISIKNADGTEWQPESGETVTVTLEASKIGLKNGDEFVVYHLHNGEVKILGTYVVENDTVTFDVDGFSKFVFALAVDTEQFEECIDKYAIFNAWNEFTGEGSFDYFWLKADPSSETEEIYEWSIYDSDFSLDQVVQVKEYYIDSENSIWFRVEAVNGLELPASLKSRPWVHLNSLDDYDSSYDTLNLFVPEDTSGEDLVVLDKYGLPVERVYMYTNEKKTLTAQTNLTGSVSYQWQVCYDIGNFLWMDITGQTSESLTLSYALLAGVSDNGFSVVRCVTSNAAETIEGAPLVVMMLEPYTDDSTYSLYGVIVQYVYDAFKALEAFGKDVSGANADSTEQVSGVTPRAGEMVIATLTAKKEDGTIIFQERYELEIGGDVNRTDIVIPYVVGYDLYDANGNVLTPQEVDGKKVYLYDVIYNDVTESFEVVLTYKPGKTTYTVEYYLQNVLDNNYTQDVTATVELVGTTGDMPDVTEDAFKKAFEGFYQLLFESEPIASDGSTTIKIYYDRLYFKMLFDLDGGYGVQPVYARYETPVSVVNPTKAGYDFMGWNAINGDYSDSDDTTVDIETFTDIEIPAMHTNYKALWKASGSAKVTVVVWGQNADDDGYSFMAKPSENLSFNAKPGTTVTYNPNGGNLCGYDEEHTHGVGDCKATCGKEEHEHTAINGSCYTLSCKDTIHTAHTESCYTCGETTHNHTVDCYNESDIGDRQNVYTGVPSNPAEGYVHDHWVYNKLIFIDGSWYRYSGSTAAGSTANTTCGKTESTHNHTDDCIKADSPCPGIHTHTESCYTLTCNKEVHAHNAACYSGCTNDEHTHSSSCKLTINGMASNLWKLNTEKTGSVTVSADGSTTLNVYYDRTTFTVTFNSDGGGTNHKTLKDVKWGTNIREEFIEASTLAKSYMWSRNKKASEGPWTSFLAVMPQENRDYYAYVSSSNNTYRATYYGLKLGGTVGNVNDYEVLFPIEFNYRTGLTITDEEFEKIDGFTLNESMSSDKGDSYNNAKFYYDRNSYNLVFDNYSKIEKTALVQYEAELDSFGTFVLDASDAPSVYQPGSVSFKGWYLAPQTPNDFDFDKNNDDKEDIAPFNFASSKMPSTDLKLYAWWEPVEHNVTFYHSREDMENNRVYVAENITYDYDVPHGSKIQTPYAPPNDPTNGRYKFDGWFYVNENGIETLWDFDNSTVTSNVKIYAKWTSNILMPYTVRFVYVDAAGKEIEIGETITGSALAGTTKTFDAKVGSELKEGYQTRYFPEIQSHNLDIDIDDVTKNVYTFYYVYRETVPYTVHYITKEDPGNGLGTIEYNGETYYKVYTTKEVKDNDKAIVTENAEMISGYVFDEYQKRLNIDAVDTSKNVIYFIYEKDTVNGQYIVHYMTENATGNGFDEHSTFTGKMSGGSTYTVPDPPKEIEHFTWAKGHEGEKLTGTVEVGKILELWVYYTRNEYPYKVQYLDKATGQPIIADKTGSAKWESQVTENYVDIKGYELSNNASYTIDISDDEKKNVITFYYVKDVTIRYQVVGPIGCGTVTPGSEDVKAITGKAQGSTAAPSSDVYKFVGWYSDKDCTVEVGKDATFVPTKDADKLWINGTTYYAKFEYNLTSLTIDKNFPKNADYSMDENQSFLFDVVEVNADGEAVVGGAQLRVTIHGDGQITIDGLTVGHYYKIIEKKDWSWRYGTCTPSSAIYKEVSADGWIIVQLTAKASDNLVTFENERTKDQWLDGDSWCNNLFK